jgi:hypothetical protein
MDWNHPITYIAAAVLATISGTIKHTVSTRKSLSGHKVHAAETFATKGELIRATDNLTDICNRIETKVDNL